MTKTVENSVLDAALDRIKNSCTQISCCHPPTPTTYAAAAANGGKFLAIPDISGADITGPVAGTSGRKITVGQ